MIILLCMLNVMGHCVTVDSPVTQRSVSDRFWKLSMIIFDVEKYHLEPEIAPAVVANW